ncbi:MAG: ATP-binding protein [Bacteroidales bacterium]|nr:ATP-binding protein [Bacteroidales bacterium]
MKYERQLLAILKSRMAEPRRRMQIIMGPRQVGKSTLAYQFCDGTDTPYDYFAADGVSRFDTAWIPNHWQEARMKMDLHSDKERILIFDEIQKIEGWSEQVKKEWDEDTRMKRNLKVILLGSSRVLLQKGLNESLEGRFEPIRMGYWDWNEMRDSFGFTMQQYIYFGGFPGLANDIHDEDRWRRLMEDTIITPILTRDILEIEEIRNPALLRQVFELACIESARELSLTKMQGTIRSGTVPTIKNYLNILDQTMTVKPMQKYATSVIKEKNSVPKMQVYNSAFRNRYGQFTFEEAVTNLTEWGRQVESAVGAHLVNRSLLDSFELLYWRDEHKKECDFVLKKGQALVAIEVKSSSADDTSGFEKFKQLYGEHITEAFIVGPEGLPLEDFFSLDIKQLFRKK